MRHTTAAYVAPFLVFLFLLAVHPYLGIPQTVEFVTRFLIVATVTLLLSRRVIDLRAPHWMAGILLGAGVFVIWIGPDLLWPHYRDHWLFHNALTGNGRSSLRQETAGSGVALAFRVLRAVVVVPIIEELFWRGWLMRWLIKSDFRYVPLGAYTTESFWMSALLFASEHGPYWDVGLLAGIAYNWWMLRTKSLGDCILAHAVTNACLCVYVLATKHWAYWM